MSKGGNEYYSFRRHHQSPEPNRGHQAKLPRGGNIQGEIEGATQRKCGRKAEGVGQLLSTCLGCAALEKTERRKKDTGKF